MASSFAPKDFILVRYVGYPTWHERMLVEELPDDEWHECLRRVERPVARPFAGFMGEYREPGSALVGVAKSRGYAPARLVRPARLEIAGHRLQCHTWIPRRGTAKSGQ